jgi:uncharacterized protein (DUF433 family)
MLEHQQECPYLWILRGDLIQLYETQKGPPLNEAAVSYRKALKLNPHDLSAIESLALFYDAVVQKPAWAKRYAGAYIEKVRQSLSEMELIDADEVVPSKLLSRITVNPEICHGQPCIRGLRYSVELLLGLQSSMSTEQILADYPDLEADDIRAACAYGAFLSRGKRVAIHS